MTDEQKCQVQNFIKKINYLHEELSCLIPFPDQKLSSNCMKNNQEIQRLLAAIKKQLEALQERELSQDRFSSIIDDAAAFCNNISDSVHGQIVRQEQVDDHHDQPTVMSESDGENRDTVTILDTMLINETGAPGQVDNVQCFVKIKAQYDALMYLLEDQEIQFSKKPSNGNQDKEQEQEQEITGTNLVLQSISSDLPITPVVGSVASSDVGDQGYYNQKYNQQINYPQFFHQPPPRQPTSRKVVNQPPPSTSLPPIDIDTRDVPSQPKVPTTEDYKNYLDKLYQSQTGRTVKNDNDGGAPNRSYNA
jgi:hypothetical protein